MDNYNRQLKDLNEQEFKELLESNPHLMTGGARHYFRRVWIGYAVLAVAMVVGIWGFTNLANRRLKEQANALGVKSCVSGIKTVEKFNDLINNNIKTQRESYKFNISQGDIKRANINKRAIKRLKKDRIIPPTVEACNIPILK